VVARRNRVLDADARQSLTRGELRVTDRVGTRLVRVGEQPPLGEGEHLRSGEVDGFTGRRGRSRPGDKSVVVVPGHVATTDSPGCALAIATLADLLG